MEALGCVLSVVMYAAEQSSCFPRMMHMAKTRWDSMFSELPATLPLHGIKTCTVCPKEQDHTTANSP